MARKSMKNDWDKERNSQRATEEALLCPVSMLGSLPKTIKAALFVLLCQTTLSETPSTTNLNNARLISGQRWEDSVVAQRHSWPYFRFISYPNIHATS